MSPSRKDLLVIAGEPSGDRIAALILRELLSTPDCCLGLGGPACRRAGMRTVVDISRVSAMGIGDVAVRLPEIAEATSRILRDAQRSPPAAALLVNFTELNVHLGRWLKRRGVRVLWCVAPQAWAWRPGRLRTLHRSLDRMAVLLPFEEPLWRAAGVDAHYVGHPSLDVPAPPRMMLRQKLGFATADRAVAILPGSRPGEVVRLAPVLCEAAAMLRSGASVQHACLLLAPWLDPRVRAVATRHAELHGICLIEGDPDHGAASLLGAFDVALSASGTACLEAALAGAAPVITYRADGITAFLARLLVKTPHIALPNVLLGRRALPEILQSEVTKDRVAREAMRLLSEGGRRTAEQVRADLFQRLDPADGKGFGVRVANLLRPWIERQ